MRASRRVAFGAAPQHEGRWTLCDPWIAAPSGLAMTGPAHPPRVMPAKAGIQSHGLDESGLPPPRERQRLAVPHPSEPPSSWTGLTRPSTRTRTRAIKVAARASRRRFAAPQHEGVVGFPTLILRRRVSKERDRRGAHFLVRNRKRSYPWLNADAARNNSPEPPHCPISGQCGPWSRREFFFSRFSS